MKEILLDKEIDLNDLNQVGGKAAVLGHLVKHGFSVPKFFVVTTSTFCKFLDIPTQDFALDTQVKTLRAKIASVKFPQEFVETISKALSSHKSDQSKNTLFTVRSSAVGEDSKSESFAGQYETFLGLHKAENVIDAIRSCWTSTVSDRVHAYKRSKGLHSIAYMAVIVQELVEAKSAGVMFTSNPIDPSSKTIMIESNFGLGVSVVQGTTTPDSFIVDSRSGEILSRTVGSKRSMCILNADATVKSVDTPADLRKKLSLNDEEITKLFVVGSQIEKLLGSPQDIEWATRDTQLYVLQARPITGGT